MEHSLLAPSSAHRWAVCAASLARCADYPEQDTEYTEEGTLAHSLAYKSLRDGIAPVRENIPENKILDTAAEEEMIFNVGAYCDQIRTMTLGAAFIWYEVKMDLSEVLGVPDQKGTGDVIALLPNGELQVYDLKYGKGVKVFAEGNKQLILYALGALSLAELVGDVKTIRLAIHQPRLDHFDEFVYTVEELLHFRDELREKAAVAVSLMGKGILRKHYNPGEKQCCFCPAKGECEALAETVFKTILDEFSDETDLKPAITEEIKKVETYSLPKFSAIFESLDLITQWAKAVREAILARLLRGEKIDGLKLVSGRAGNRAWVNEQVVEAAMKAMRLKFDEMYTKNLISVAVAEKLLKKRPRLWHKLEDKITSPEPKPAIALESDKRPAIDVNAIKDEFEVEI